jgi:hypothetical protein
MMFGLSAGVSAASRLRCLATGRSSQGKSGQRYRLETHGLINDSTRVWPKVGLET